MRNPTSSWEADPSCIHIGLVNNMPDSALQATERQFRTLLCEAADGIAMRLSLFALPEVPRSEKARRRIDSSYSNLSALWNSHLDGLIVTGAEPVAQDLAKEPFWATLAQLVDWAGQNTYSSAWSCLAAHAAVLRMDGIERRPFTDKLFGLFESAKRSGHNLILDAPSRYSTPHSRWNDLPESALSACGYRILAQLNNGSADIFTKQRKSLFVFFQGHPEYDADSLLLEYRRDIRRFLCFERDVYPAMPQGVFDKHSAVAFSALRERAMSDRREEALAEFPATTLQNTWRPQAVRLYRNWLRFLSEQKHKEQKRRPRPATYRLASGVAPERRLVQGAEAR